MLMCLMSDGAVERLFLSLNVKTNAIKKAKVILSEAPIKGLFIAGVLKVYIQRSEWELSSTSKGPK